MIQKITLLIVLSICNSLSAQILETDSRSHASKLIQTYCVTCHNESLRTANLLLDQANINQADQQPATWEKVVRRLRARSMPPQGLPRPDPADYEFLIKHLENDLDKAAIANPNPGRSVSHRLNRAEYANAVRDILGLEINVDKLLPTDAASGHGFDNIADVLTLSPVLMESYLSAAKTISRLAIGDPRHRPEVEFYFTPANQEQQERVSEELPLGSNGGIAVSHFFPLDGEYVARVRLRRLITGLYAGKIIGFTQPKEMEIRLDGEKIEHFTVGGPQVSDDELVIRFPVTAGKHTLGVNFLRDKRKAEGIVTGLAGTEFGSGVGWVEVEGPYNPLGAGETPSQQKIFSCRPNRLNAELNCAKEILSKLARNAYRRPVTDLDINPLMRLYRSERKVGEFDRAIGMAIQGILISPKFLFRIEHDPDDINPDSAYPITDLELASRLSFFIWSSVPDESLIDLAARGKLRDPGVLEQQVLRMLQDPRSRSMVDNFASQWLHVRNLDLLSPPDPTVFKKYNYNLKSAFKKEIELLFDYVIHEDRSVMDFLNADYTFLNERLARHYGISGVYGSHFRRVTLTDESRWGLLGKGSILTTTSYATRTSPTLRGKWILENILGTPPPPPPPDVPSLKETADTKNLSMRERMAMHRTNPVCASCHSLMDPLGLALENFDAIGSFRKVNSDQTPIDASGILPNGAEFNGPAQLREALWQGREQFVSTFTERVLTYALGRGLEHYDMPAVRKIMHEAEKNDYRWSSIVMQVVESQPFQMRRSTGP
jgi:hypothetical protein